MQLSKVVFSVIYLQVVLCETPAYVAHWYSMFISKATEEREQKNTDYLVAGYFWFIVHCLHMFPVQKDLWVCQVPLNVPWGLTWS